MEVFTPKLVASGAEGGSTLFKVDYFGKVAYLAQSPQLYKQMLMSTGLDRVFEIGPAFRAEPSDTARHVSEFISFDGEMAHIDSQSDVMSMIEGCTQFVISEVKERGGWALQALGCDVVVPKAPYPVVSYEKAVGMVQGAGLKIDLGEDLGTEGEKLLGELMTQDGHEMYWIAEYPEEAKPFYIMEKDGTPYSFSFDLDYKEDGEEGSGPEVVRVLPERLRLWNAVPWRLGPGRRTNGAEDAWPEQHPRDDIVPEGPQPAGPLNSFAAFSG